MVLLDTHALLWWVNGDSQLSQHALEAIEHELQIEDGEILISVISAWEIALPVEKGRLSLSSSTHSLDSNQNGERASLVRYGVHRSNRCLFGTVATATFNVTIATAMPVAADGPISESHH
ncbi:type II toxin-antitoxin system VapC family toxin [Litchfieldella anticariensis]|uniref:type II toxin-antitoxin system VapC family toxin n=1 Tax=Litchfieldella anticariensis TaxID=258591 RepID=UPI002E816441|nr:PIN domain-containing protein [Halomonas anticariensis]